MTADALSENPQPGEDEGGAVKLEFTASPGFSDWLASIDCSIVFTAYQSSKIVFLGRDKDGALKVSEGDYFARCMGLGVHANSRCMTITTKQQLIRLENLVPPGHEHEGHDAIYMPHKTWITGFLDTHDVATMADKSLLFVNTMFSCLATVSDGYSFKPIWQPDFITELVPEDRCHLNGMAIDANTPRFVTTVAATNTEKGWRDRLADGGLLIDVATRKPVLDGLSMPHSPRIHNGRLWMLQTGLGAFGYVDFNPRKFVQVALCPGFARGLALHGNYAVVCISLPRGDEKDFSNLPLGDILAKRGEEPRCGLMAIDIRNGETVAWLTAHAGARELFDVGFLPGVRNPKVIDFMNEDMNKVIMMDQRA